MGDMRISYAKFLQLLEANRVKRVVVYGDMKTAIIEVCFYYFASGHTLIVFITTVLHLSTMVPNIHAITHSARAGIFP